jgi:hypothetical protein
VGSKAATSVRPLETTALPLDQLAEAGAAFEIIEEEAVNVHHNLSGGGSASLIAFSQCFLTGRRQSPRIGR